MMTRTTLLAIVVLGVALAAAGVAHLARAEEAAPVPVLSEPGEAEVATAIESPTADPNPIVAVVVGRSDTEYEQDPFEPGRMRSSQTRVKTLLFVHADGTVESKQVP